jgi:beta-aspartyl-peptidase (threonine type)
MTTNANNSAGSGPVLVIHGGAWSIPDELVQRHLDGVRKALEAGWHALERGGSAIDAVEAAVVVMEDDDVFDAGTGSFLNSEGHVQMDALMMDGATLRAGGLGCVERIKNPIRAARKVLEESPHVYFVGAGAERFAEEHGIQLCDNSELVVAREIEHLRQTQVAAASGATSADPFVLSHDTVGAVALDSKGHLAAATSTGGTINKTPGRVGDSSLIGCGCYADDTSGAVSTTGWGEPIMKLVLGKWAVDRIGEGGDPAHVAWRAMDYLKSRLNGHGGIILLDRAGRFGLAHNTPRMAAAWRNRERDFVGVNLDRRKMVRG